MTKKELQEVHQFLVDMENSDDKIEIAIRAWNWLRKIYHIQGKQKIEEYDKTI